MSYYYDKVIFRRIEIIDEVFYQNLNNDRSINMIKVKLNFTWWSRNIVSTTTNNIMLYSFELEPWREETRYIFQYIYDFIENKYRCELEEFYYSVI